MAGPGSIPGRSRKNLLPYLLIAPAFILIFIFFFYPFLNNLFNSFIRPATLTRPARFVGLANYAYIFSQATFRQALLNTLIWTVGVTAFQFILGMITALVINLKRPFINSLRPLYIVPWATPGIVTALAWRWMYNADYGIINSVLFQSGVIREYLGWLADPSLAMLSVIAVGVWKGFPFYMLMLYAGLQGIPTELYESGEIDGASALQAFLYITIPQLKVIISMSVTLGIIWTSNYFDAIYVLTGGGPARITETLPLYIYNTAFAYFRFNDEAGIGI